jgi:periplasmic protein CpxP/Spy
MKSLFKVLISALAFGLVASAPMLRAQDPATPTPPPADGGGAKKGKGKGGMMTPEQRLAAIDKAVTLTDDQKPKVKDILDKAQTDVQAAAGDRSQIGDIMQKANGDIRALLTDDQKTKFDAMPQPGRGKKKGGG